MKGILALFGVVAGVLLVVVRPPSLVALLATGPAEKMLPDGRNAHLIQQPKQWWLDKVVASDFHVVAAGDGVNSRNEVVGCWLECAPC